MIKRILVPTDGSDSAHIGIRYACALAAKSGAQLAGVFVVDVKLLEGPFLRDLSASLGTAPFVNYQGGITQILEERGKAALAAFEEECGKHGIACETVLTTGLVPRAIVEQGELCDLIVMGRAGEHSAFLEGFIGSTAEAVARHASTPVLVTGVEHPAGDCIVAAYDSSAHARQALKSAAALALEWKLPLDLLVAGEQDADAAMEEAKHYLQSHAISVQYTHRGGEPAEAIVSHARERRAGLIAMGAYSRPKVLEWIVGSTTAYVLNHAPCPVLLTR